MPPARAATTGLGLRPAGPARTGGLGQGTGAAAPGAQWQPRRREGRSRPWAGATGAGGPPETPKVRARGVTWGRGEPQQGPGPGARGRNREGQGWRRRSRAGASGTPGVCGRTRPALGVDARPAPARPLLSGGAGPARAPGATSSGQRAET